MAISVDIFGRLPVAKSGFKYVLVVMDKFSKHFKLYPMVSQDTRTIIAKLENYFVKVGKPAKILTNNAGQFKGNERDAFAFKHDIETKKITPYNPQSNSVKRVLGELGRII